MMHMKFFLIVGSLVKAWLSVVNQYQDFYPTKGSALALPIGSIDFS